MKLAHRFECHVFEETFYQPVVFTKNSPIIDLTERKRKTQRISFHQLNEQHFKPQKTS